MVSDAIHILEVATAVGIDLWSPANLRKLLNGALRQLANILQQVEICATCPSYMLYNIIVLMGSHRAAPDPLHSCQCCTGYGLG
eukprot:5204863-Karenia_brevis.AAC.1